MTVKSGPVEWTQVPGNMPTWDTTSGGVPIQFCYRGYYDGTAYFVANGGVLGSGQTNTQRGINTTVLNALFAAMISNGKRATLQGGIYETNANLTTGIAGGVNNSGFVLHGEYNATRIIQFPSGSATPVLTVGDTTGTTLSYGYWISGLVLEYGGNQSATTAAFLQIAHVTECIFEKIYCGAFASNSYNGLVMQNVMFSCSLRDFVITPFTQYGIYNNVSGSTQNYFENFYIFGNSAAVVSYIFSVFFCPNQFTRLNLEWGSCNVVVDYGTNGFGSHVLFESTHCEGITLTGFNPCFFFSNFNQFELNQFEVVTTTILAANLTGQPALIRDETFGNTSSYAITGLQLSCSGSATIQDTAFLIFNGQNNNLDDFTPNIELTSWYVQDSSTGAQMLTNRAGFDSKLPPATFRTPIQAGRYSYGPALSIVSHAFLQNLSTTYTHYGQYENAVIQVPASITSFTITLAATMGATGNQFPRTGNTVRIRRHSGTASGTLTVSNGGAGGGTLTAPNTAGTDGWYQFNGTNWVLLTPVTS